MKLNKAADPDLPEHPWPHFVSSTELEAWMELNNQELQQLLGPRAQHGQGQGICLTLLHGGEIYFHTNGDGDILLDVSEDALWVTPVLTATTRQTPPKGRIWRLPGDVLIQLLMGLNSLVASSRLVLKHRYGMSS